MGREIERKYLVEGDGWAPADDGRLQRQGYLAVHERGAVRVRIEEEEATLTIKGAQSGLTRAEYEYPVPLKDAEEMMEKLCGLVVEKTRYRREFGGRIWEVDVFHRDNEGLVTAEVELDSEDAEVEVPPWVGEDVSHDMRYRVTFLARQPYRTWTDPTV